MVKFLMLTIILKSEKTSWKLENILMHEVKWKLLIPQARILEWVAFPFSRRSSQPRDQTHVSSLQADSLPAEPQGKPKNTGVDSLSLLQRIFLTQGSNQGLLHGRQIVYQLSYQGSPCCWCIYCNVTGKLSDSSSDKPQRHGIFRSKSFHIHISFKCVWVSH